MERSTDLSANKPRRLAIFINISFYGGNFHETCIVELWPPNRKKATTTWIVWTPCARSNTPIIFSTNNLNVTHNNWNFNFAWISYHDISNNALWKIAGPFLSCWCVELHDMDTFGWVCVRSLRYSNMQNTLMFAFSYANCDQLLTSTKLDVQESPVEWKRPENEKYEK